MNYQARATQFIKSEAKRLGFDFCGISKAEFLAEEALRLENFLHRQYQGNMSYLENHFDKRLDPRKLHEGTRSVVSFLLNYYPTQKQNPSAPKISKYAYGKDYHFVIKNKLKELLHNLQEEYGEINGRAFVDSAPVLDKTWAAKGGLGWMGKHTNLINKKQGSFFFVAELFLDIDLAYDGPVKDYCGTCTKCIDACPTDAIVEPYVVDGSKCISYFTIELKGKIPERVKGKFEDWAFGCDICQDVCPWNRFSKAHQEPLFNPHPNLIDYSTKDWEDITEEVFREIFKQSAVKRTKFEGLKRNLKFLNEELD